MQHEELHAESTVLVSELYATMAHAMRIPEAWLGEQSGS